MRQHDIRWGWRCTAGAIAIAAAACANGSERAPGTPYTDITRTSTEVYAHATPYAVREQHRNGSRVDATINVSNIGNGEAIARQAGMDLKGDAQEIELRIYDAEAVPPAPPWARASMTGGRFTFERLPDREQAHALKH